MDKNIKFFLVFLNGILLLFVFISNANSQTTPKVEWEKTFGGTKDDEAISVRETKDHGYIITGFTESYGNGGKDVYLAKTDSQGNLLWSNTYGGSGDDGGASVQETADGGYVIAGVTTSYGAGGSDVYLIKTDSHGNLLWSKTFGGTKNDGANSIQQTNDGGYILVGITKSNYKDVYLIKTDKKGNKLWERIFDNNGANDYGRSVVQTTDNGYVIVGATMPNLYLIKTNLSGNIMWSKIIGSEWKKMVGGTTSLSSISGNSVKQAKDGGYIIAGEIQKLIVVNNRTNVDHDILLLKTDSYGNEIWHKTFGGAYYDSPVGYYQDYGHSVIETEDGGYIALGYGPDYSRGGTASCVHLIKTDSNGNELWQKPFGKWGEGNSIQQTRDGGFIVAGEIRYDVYLLKLATSIHAIEKRYNVSITANPSNITANFPNNESTTLRITVTSVDEPVEGASVNLEADHEGFFASASFGRNTTDQNGIYNATYTPLAIPPKSTEVVIIATVSKSGFTTSTAQTSIIVNHPSWPPFEKEIVDESGEEIGLKIRINYPTSLQANEKGLIEVELVTFDAKEGNDAKERKINDSVFNIYQGVIKLGSDESLHNEKEETELWIDPIYGFNIPSYTYFPYENLISSDKTASALLEAGVKVLSSLPLSDIFFGTYDILNWEPSVLQEKANYDIGNLPKSEVFKNENDYDQWRYNWSFDYYVQECVGANRVKLKFPFSFEKEGEHYFGTYINVEFIRTGKIMKIAYEPTNVFYITVE